MMKTVVIGGGASGMSAAVAAARTGQEVLVLEGERKPLRKLAVAGNGRGNLLNMNPVRYGGNAGFAEKVLEQMPPPKIWEFWQSVGISPSLENEGRVYPSTFLAASAVDALLLEAALLGIEVRTGIRAERIGGQQNSFVIYGTESVFAPDIPRKNGKSKPGALLEQRAVSFCTDRVIICCGGSAAPQFGTDGTSYGLLCGMGHRLIPPRPALCAVITDPPPSELLSGIRVKVGLSVSENGEAYTSRGEMLFTADGLSGIAVMDLSRYLRHGSVLHADLRPGLLGSQASLSFGETVRFLAERQNRLAGLPASKILTGLAPAPLAAKLLKHAGIPEEENCSRISPVQLEKLASVMTDCPFCISGTRDFDAAQVTAGGVDPAQFDPRTMESLICPGLYAAGEVLDVDGPCGGFNLMFAAASGILAGRNGK